MWLNSLYKEFEQHSESSFEFEKLFNALKNCNKQKKKTLKLLQTEQSTLEERQTYSFLHKDETYHLETQLLELGSKIKTRNEELKIHSLYSDQREHIIKRHEKQILRLKNEKLEIEFLIEKVNKLQERVMEDVSRVNQERSSYRNKIMIEQKQSNKMNESLQYQMKYKSQQARVEQEQLTREKSIFLTMEDEIQDKKQLKVKLSQIAESMIGNESILSSQRELTYQNQLHYLNEMFLGGRSGEKELEILGKLRRRLEELQQQNEGYERHIFSRFEEKDRLEQRMAEQCAMASNQQRLLAMEQFSEYKELGEEEWGEEQVEELRVRNRQVQEDIKAKDQLGVHVHQFLESYSTRIHQQLRRIQDEVCNHKLDQLVALKASQPTRNTPIDCDLLIEHLIYEVDKHCEEHYSTQSLNFPSLLETWNSLFNRPIMQFTTLAHFNAFSSKILQNALLVIDQFRHNLHPADNHSLVCLIVDDILTTELLAQFAILDLNTHFLSRVEFSVAAIQKILTMLASMIADLLKGSINGKYSFHFAKQESKSKFKEEVEDFDKYATLNVIDDSDFNQLNSRFKIQPKSRQINNDTLLQEFKYFLSSRSCAKSQSPDRQLPPPKRSIKEKGSSRFVQEYREIVQQQKTYNSIKSLNRSYEGEFRKQPKVYKMEGGGGKRGRSSSRSKSPRQQSPPQQQSPTLPTPASSKLPLIKAIKYK